MKEYLKTPFIIVAFLFGCVSNSSAQKIVFSDGHNFYQSNTSTGYCTYYNLNIATCFLRPGGIFSIAMYKDTLYFSNEVGDLCYSLLSNPSVCVWLDSNIKTDAMTVNKNGYLFFVNGGDSLIEYNPHTKTKNILGILNYSPSGDLLFFGNDLIMSGSNGEIVNVNLNNPNQSIALFKDTAYLCWGLANVSTACNPHSIIGYSTIESTNATTVVQIDMNKKTITPLCVLPFQAFDAGSAQEIGGNDPGIGDTSFSVLDTMGCVGSQLLLDAGSPGATYLWEDNSTYETRYVTSPGAYWVSVNDAGCVNIDTIYCSFYNSPQVYLPKDTTVCLPDPIKLLPIVLQPNSLPNSYTWQDGSTQPNYQISKSGLYTLNTSNSCGSILDSVRVDFQNCNCNFYVPNGFTPNDDGINDVFAPKYICGFNGVVTNYQLRIFNRWGQLMFFSESPHAYWDGKYKGQLQPVGSYVWELEYNDNNIGKLVNISGVVLLIR